MVPGGKGRGVALYIKNELYKKVTKINTANHPDVQALLIQFPSMLLGGVYVPPRGDAANVVSKLELCAKGGNCVILGDFNYDYARSPKHPIRMQMDTLGFQQVVTSPTHYKGNTIDHIYRRGSMEVEVRKNAAHYSDHFCLGVIFEKSNAFE